MNNAIKVIFSFALGAGAGALVAWKVTAHKYERMCDEAIADVKARYSVPKDTETHDEKSKTDEEESNDEDEPDAVDTYIDIASTYASDDGGKENKRSMIKPHVIPVEDFDTFGYNTATLTYYADGVLADEWDRIIKNADDIVGDDFQECLEEEDSVYVRNDELKCDYEILRDLQTYAEAVGESEYDPED
jgi:hypothetical protein